MPHYFPFLILILPMLYIWRVFLRQWWFWFFWFVCLFLVLVCFSFFEKGFLCVSWNSLCRPAWPPTQKFACLCLLSAGIKSVCHHCPRPILGFESTSLDSWILWWLEWEEPPKADIVSCLVVWEWYYLRRIRRCGLVGGSMSLGVGFEVSKARARPSLSLL